MSSVVHLYSWLWAQSRHTAQSGLECETPGDRGWERKALQSVARWKRKLSLLSLRFKSQLCSPKSFDLGQVIYPLGASVFLLVEWVYHED